jgi:hypothetical protein
MNGKLTRVLLLSIFLLLASANCLAQVSYDHQPKKYSSYTLSDNKWNKTTISYKFKNTTQDFPNCEVAIRQAFDIWSTAAGLTFVEISNEQKADITISWERGNHGDSFPFTDRKTLAHASTPDADTEIHFNEDEDWTDSSKNNNDQPVDLVTVAAHEIGHALGLDHSNDKNSLMYPTYSKSHRYLDSDDVSGIQALYPKQNQILDGKVTFDIAKNNPFRIGSDDFTFDVAFSRGGSKSVYVYDDPSTIDGVALAEDVQEIEQIADPTKYDMSSRVRTVSQGKLFVLKNNHGYYALAELVNVDYKETSDEPVVNVTLRYKIIPKLLLPTWIRTPQLYVSSAMEGYVDKFNYTNNSGTFTIGQGDYTFDTMWSGCGSTCIYAYTDSETVDGVALALDAREIEQVTDPTKYDRSSRVRTLRNNNILVLNNKNGYYAVLKLTDVEYEKSISFRYKIIPNKLASTWRMDKRLYTSTPLEGSVRDFEFTNNNGVFSIGEGEYLFNTEWAGCSSSCVYLLNDSGIQISFASGINEIGQVTDVNKYPKATRIITVEVNGVVILKNPQGHYAILKVIKITEGMDSRKLSFNYKIIDS